MSQKNNQQNKTEEPTQRRLEKAREEGNVAKSTEIASVLLMVITTVILLHSGNWIYSRIEHIFKSFFKNSKVGAFNQESAIEYLQMAAGYSLEMISPFLIGMVVIAVIAHVGQTGVVFAKEALNFKPERMDPFHGFKKIFSMHGVVELVKGFSKIFLIGLIIYFTFRTEITNIASFMVMPLGQILSESGGYTLQIMSRILSALIILSIMDAVYMQYKHRKDLRMTKKEVKDERKQMEGDPHVKSKRKQMAMGMRNQKRLDHAVLSSEVVVTNPTHYAVALSYEPQKHDAPKICAKGMRKRALKIREYAEEFDIPIVENPPVARALHATADEDEFVPPELYQAVAEILAYVYRLKQKNNY